MGNIFISLSFDLNDVSLIDLLRCVDNVLVVTQSVEACRLTKESKTIKAATEATKASTKAS